MRDVLAVAGGGALGAVARYFVYVAAARILGTKFPFGTLIVNITGSMLMGMLVEAMAEVWSLPSEVGLFLGVGFLGAFTTFSTFSVDFAVLYERGQFLLCAVYACASVVLSIGGVFLGIFFLRSLLA